MRRAIRPSWNPKSRSASMGSINKRANGRYTAVGRPERNQRGKLTRPTVGTFPTRRDAKDALASFEESIRSGTLGMESAALRHVPLGTYLDGWLDLLSKQQRAGVLLLASAS